jgi:nicotinic acid phosphoribosyltransferase
MKFNILNQIDAYKLDHRRQYPEGTTYVLSNFTPRTSRIEGVDKVVFFGLQAFLDDFHEGFKEFFARDVDEVCAEYEQNTTEILGPNEVGSDHIRALHNLGYVPLNIKALPEGVSVDLKVPMFTVEPTHDIGFWLVNYFESAVSAAVWLPCTSATQAKRYRETLEEWADFTGVDKAVVDFQLHDFSFRGLSSIQSAASSGAGHLIYFLGSDSLPSKDFIKNHYGPALEPVLLSVPATEHSVMCAGGNETELETFDRLLDLYPSGIVSVVSDTWDLWNVIGKILPELKDKILARDGKLVIRPDSGDPANILCGLNTNPDYIWDGAPLSNGMPYDKGVIELLWDLFGGTVNEKGYKELDPHIGAIYGDSITFDRANDICQRLAGKGFASSNVVFGVGSYTYQYVTRDTFGFAMKATYVEINGEGREIFKDPITDSGTKKSAKGRLAVLKDANTGDFILKDQLSAEELESLDELNWLRTVYLDGKFVNPLSWQDVKANAGR